MLKALKLLLLKAAKPKNNLHSADVVKLIVGLGNPGEKYTDTRHNAGFWAVDDIHRLYAFSPWQKKFNGLFATGEIDGVKVGLLKPMTYMNKSGDSVQPCAAFFKISVEDVFVFHDELDILPGKVKAKKGGGAAGHNGLKSIDSRMGNQNYWRVRLGIGHPGHKDMVSGYVLHKASKEEHAAIEDSIYALSKKLPALLNGDTATFLDI